MRNKGLIIAWVTAGIALVAGLWVLSRFIFPPPPDRVTMATGNAQGTYHAAAVRYQRLLQEDDIQLDLVQTAGAVENLQMLQAGEVDLAFLQGGLTPTDTDALMGLCSAFLEPLWIFTLEDADIHDLRDLQARRVTIGPPGSGTRVLATRLLTAVGASEDVTTWQEQTLTAKALHDKVSDAGLIVSSLKSERVRTLLRTPGLRPISLRRRDAYAQRYPYLEAIELPEGVIDLKENLPGQTIQGVAAAASIVARKDLHPGVITVFLMAVQRTHE
ncbi:MAG: TAXI family TRAP transporter solute-binding subunit, partial [Myxococcota bacterium]